MRSMDIWYLLTILSACYVNRDCHLTHPSLHLILLQGARYLFEPPSPLPRTNPQIVPDTSVPSLNRHNSPIIAVKRDLILHSLIRGISVNNLDGISLIVRVSDLRSHDGTAPRRDRCAITGTTLLNGRVDCTLFGGFSFVPFVFNFSKNVSSHRWSEVGKGGYAHLRCYGSGSNSIARGPRTISNHSMDCSASVPWRLYLIWHVSSSCLVD